MPRPALRERAPSYGDEAIPTSILDRERLSEQSDAPLPEEPAFAPAFIYVEKGPGSGQLIPLRQGVTVIGRASIADLRLQHPSISRRHAQLTRRGNRFLLRDLGSQNGTVVNGKRIQDQLELFPGDELAMGNAILKLRGPASPVEVRRHTPPSRVSSVSQPYAPVTAAPSANLSPLTRVAVLAGAVGFGLASVLLVAVFNLMRSVPTEAPEAPLPEIVLMEEASVGNESERGPEEEAPGADAPENRVATAARIQAVTAKSAAAEEEPASARPVAAAPKRQATPTPEPSKPSAAPASVVAVEAKAPAPAPPPPAPKSNDAEALTRYESGDLNGALALAGRSALGLKIARFKSAYEAGKAAFARRDGSVALRQFAAAVKLDEEISSGWSKYGLELNAQLSQLYTLVGLQHTKSGNAAAARKAFSVALKHNPKNTRAQTALDALAPAAPPKTISREAAIDAAFD